MNIFYTPPDWISHSKLELNGQEAHHAAKVLRYEAGDFITVVDGRGGWYEGTVSHIDRDAVQVDIESREQEEKPLPDIHLGMAIIKKRDRLEFAVEKAVELGVSGIILFEGEHSEKNRVRLDRLETIAVNAMKQSLRTFLPEVSRAPSLEEIVKAETDTQVIIAKQGAEPVRTLWNKIKGVDELLLVVGPEGGLSDREIVLAEEFGAKSVSLSPKRLRTETAALTLISALSILTH